MQALKKVNGKWIEEKPEDLLRWMWKNDGEEAVIKAPGVTYCATEALKAAYEAKGKTALMFFDLSQKLPAAPFDPTDSPMYCNTYSILCSERVECTDDCCYQGGER